MADCLAFRLQHQRFLQNIKASCFTIATVRFRDVFDGTAHTAVIGECTGRDQSTIRSGPMATTFSTINTTVSPNESQDNELFSDHPGGLNIAFADGHVTLFIRTNRS